MLTTWYSSNTGMQARQMLERKPPRWTSTLSSTRSFSVLRRPTSGLDSSSAMTSSIGRPLMPPDLLMRSTAICRPTSAVLPPAAPAPDSGCRVPTLYGLAWPKAARHGAGTSMTAPSAPAVAPPSGREARLAIRRGGRVGPTSGLAPGYVQGNLAILPNALASDFLRFCQLNPKPCPLLAASAPGDWRLPALAEDLDIRTDISRYRVFRAGELIDEPTDLRAHWRDDLVSFALGCSFSFEEAL